MSLRAEFVAAVRACVGTPFRHRGRTPGKELDCVGVPIAAARSLGIEVIDAHEYAERPSEDELLGALRDNCDEIAIDEAREGSILAFRIGRRVTHVAVQTDSTRMVHALDRRLRTVRGYSMSRVIEDQVTERWRGRLAFAFDMKGVGRG